MFDYEASHGNEGFVLSGEHDGRCDSTTLISEQPALHHRAWDGSLAESQERNISLEYRSKISFQDGSTCPFAYQMCFPQTRRPK